MWPANVSGQHDRQDERLTGQSTNEAGHCPLIGRYFEPWLGIFGSDVQLSTLWLCSIFFYEEGKEGENFIEGKFK